ncbi:MAG: hypothetical protein ABR554_00270 [Pyrinomonadaceae bacterium]
MITGFNTDIEHEGTVYHVQTEDKGLETPFILSLVYVGGAILASKRSPYTDLVASGFDQAILSERLQRQHKLICAAVSAGRIDDLKRMSQGDAGAQAAPAKKVAPRGKGPQRPPADGPAERRKMPPWPNAPAQTAPPAAAPPAAAAAPPAAPPLDARAQNNGGDATPTFDAIPVESEDELHLTLMEEKDFRAGDIVTLRLMVTRGAFGDRVTVPDASVTVKVLGTEFRPLILSSRTDADGVAMIHVWLPRFTKGRAAILLRAISDGCAAELRRVIHHS